jgi:hypothetical protein
MDILKVMGHMLSLITEAVRIAQPIITTLHKATPIHIPVRLEQLILISHPVNEILILLGSTIIYEKVSDNLI